MTDDTKKAEKTKAEKTDFEKHIEVLDAGKAKADDRHRAASEVKRLYQQLQIAHREALAEGKKLAADKHTAERLGAHAVSELGKAQTRIEELIGQPAKLQGKLDRSSKMVGDLKKKIAKLESKVDRLDAEFPEEGIKEVAQSLPDGNGLSNAAWMENTEKVAEENAKARAAKAENGDNEAKMHFYQMASKLGVPNTVIDPWRADLEMKHGALRLTKDHYVELETRLLPVAAATIREAIFKFDTDKLWTNGIQFVGGKFFINAMRPTEKGKVSAITLTRVGHERIKVTVGTLQYDSSWTLVGDVTEVVSKFVTALAAIRDTPTSVEPKKATQPDLGKQTSVPVIKKHVDAGDGQGSVTVKETVKTSPKVAPTPGQRPSRFSTQPVKDGVLTATGHKTEEQESVSKTAQPKRKPKTIKRTGPEAASGSAP